jgi:hypothetical protein
MNNISDHSVKYEIIRLSTGEQITEASISADVEDQNGYMNNLLLQIATEENIAANELAWRAIAKH